MAIDNARLIRRVADILDPAEQHITEAELAAAAIAARGLLRAAGIHPGQRDGDGHPVPPPHDDDCHVCQQLDQGVSA